MRDARETFFEDVEPVRHAGPDATEPLAFRWYDPDREGDLGRGVLEGRTTLADLHGEVAGLDPHPVSGRQEMLENVVARAIDRGGRR